MTHGSLSELIKKIAPTEYNSIIIDNAVAIKRYNYCYIHAETQRVSYRSRTLTAAVGRLMGERIIALKSAGEQSPLAKVDNDLLEQMEQAPKMASGGFFSNTRKKMDELINGGINVSHGDLRLVTDGDRLSLEQPCYAIKSQCSVADCPTCKGEGTVEIEDTNDSSSQQGVQTVKHSKECPNCKGFGRIGTIELVVPTVASKEVTMVRCLEGEITNLKNEVIERHLGNDTTPRRMLIRFNGTEQESFDEAILPFLDMIRDKVGEDNAIEDIYYRIVPCFTFGYRNVLTSEVRTGVIIDPFQPLDGEGPRPELILALDGSSRRLFSGINDSVKKIGSFFGSIGKSGAFKDKQDLRRTVRLLIAVVVADGIVNDEEKKTLTLAIRNIDTLTTGEQDELVRLLGEKDSSFLTDEDFAFHKKENVEETLVRMQEIAGSDGEVHETERAIIEKLKLFPNQQ